MHMKLNHGNMVEAHHVWMRRVPITSVCQAPLWCESPNLRRQRVWAWVSIILMSALITFRDIHRHLPHISKQVLAFEVISLFSFGLGREGLEIGSKHSCKIFSAVTCHHYLLLFSITEPEVSEVFVAGDKRAFYTGILPMLFCATWFGAGNLYSRFSNKIFFS